MYFDFVNSTRIPPARLHHVQERQNSSVTESVEGFLRIPFLVDVENGDIDLPLLMVK